MNGSIGMRSEVDDLVEHLERFRAVTLQVLDLVEEDELAWRPGPDHYSLGQQLLHIAQAEDFHAHGLFEGDWNYDRVRFPRSIPDRSALREVFARVREFTREHLARVGADDLGRVVNIPGSPLEHSLRSWLWFMVEHEIHHKAQISVYLRQMGRTAPFYAMPLPPGERPDIQVRQDLGGF